MTHDEKVEKYQALLHAIQTGVGWDILEENPDCFDVNANPNLRYHKHLRVGIDSAKVEHGALAALLIEKGVFTEDEYMDALIKGMEDEKARHEKILSERYNKNIKLA